MQKPKEGDLMGKVIQLHLKDTTDPLEELYNQYYSNPDNYRVDPDEYNEDYKKFKQKRIRTKTNACNLQVFQKS